MPKICYRTFRFRKETVDCIAVVNQIINEFAAQGFDMTLRQVYYQLVARDLFPDDRKWRWTGSKWERDPGGTENAEPNYKWLGDVVNDGRLAGMIDWNRITDRTRSLRALSHWDRPGDIVRDASHWYNVDLWATQTFRPEVWIEKDALVGVFENVCTQNDVPYFSCRGYTSQSEMWAAGQRIYQHISDGQRKVIFHFGDHDPSGLDMTRDITDRLRMFLLHHWAEDNGYDLANANERQDVEDEIESLFEVRRMALSVEQVEQYNPPPNPAKQTDSRWQKYVAATGLEESWELDALEPAVLVGLVNEGLTPIREQESWDEAGAREQKERQQLVQVAREWDQLMTHLGEKETKKGNK